MPGYSDSCIVLSTSLGLRRTSPVHNMTAGPQLWPTIQTQEAKVSRQSDMDNHANQLNPNNDAYWESRGYDERPDDWEDHSDEEGRSPSNTQYESPNTERNAKK